MAETDHPRAENESVVCCSQGVGGNQRADHAIDHGLCPAQIGRELRDGGWCRSPDLDQQLDRPAHCLNVIFAVRFTIPWAHRHTLFSASVERPTHARARRTTSEQNPLTNLRHGDTLNDIAFH